MDLIPAMKYPNKPWKMNRKRRRSGNELNDNDEKAEEKIIKTDVTISTTSITSNK